MVTRARFAVAATAFAALFSAGAVSPSHLTRPPPGPLPQPAVAPPVTPVVSTRPSRKLINDLVDRHRAEDVAAVDPQTRCLAETVIHEASNQPLEGQLAVAELIVRRVRSPAFPKTVCGVISQPGQFSPPGRAALAPGAHGWRTAVAVARIALQAATPEVAPGALFFHASYALPSWGRRRAEVARIGDQIFYR